VTTALAGDNAALRAACEPGAGLCTIVGIEGSFSRRLGAQLAVHPDGSVTGSLADGCLENQLASEILSGRERRVTRFGAGSSLIDFRLPCGSGLDILIDPEPDREACRQAVAALDRREEASLPLLDGPLRRRRYIPGLRLQLFGEGPELQAMASIAEASGHDVQIHAKDDSALSLGRRPEDVSSDTWSAIVLLFHDHEWEQAILQWALDTPAFFIGAQGGRAAREERLERLGAAGVPQPQLQRITSPIGIVTHSREPVALALSVLAQISGAYEHLHPHN
jgi:xanthine dehydrogenase accessory factor